MNKEDLKNIEAKLKKLITLQQGAEKIGSLEEAAVAAAKIQKFLIRYNLELDQLNLEEQKDTQIDNERFNMKEMYRWNKTQGNWMVNLYHVIAKFNMCRGVGLGSPTHYWDPQIQIFGERHNIELVKDLAGGLISQIKHLEKTRWKEVEPLGIEKRNTFRRSYYVGAIEGIRTKLYEQEQEVVKEYPKATGLMKRTDIVIKNAIEEYFGKDRLTSSRSTSYKGNTGRMMGRKDGKSMGMNRSMKGGSSGQKLLG